MMFVPKKEHEELKERVKELENLTGTLMRDMIEMQKELKKEPDYFG